MATFNLFNFFLLVSLYWLGFFFKRYIEIIFLKEKKHFEILLAFSLKHVKQVFKN
jgi:hypothetical protein